ILPPHVSLQWIFACAQNKRYLSPMSTKARKRKRYYDNKEIIFTALKRASLMKDWQERALTNYIDNSYQENEQREFELRHDPNWEAALFEGMPFSASWGFLKLGRSARKKITPYFFVGELSDTCYPKANCLVKFFFPKMHWTFINKGKHMFPISNPTLTVRIIKEKIKALIE
ncbi:MAG: hypothetical protein K2X39_02365, partial [Silvanigrellaceae bacterium]|nr:hypothetical protein [Silvanigrellaceae bacterium]